MCFDASMWAYLWGEKSFITMSKLYMWNFVEYAEEERKNIEKQVVSELLWHTIGRTPK